MWVTAPVALPGGLERPAGRGDRPRRRSPADALAPVGPDRDLAQRRSASPASRWTIGRPGDGLPIETWVYRQDRDNGFAVFADPTRRGARVPLGPRRPLLRTSGSATSRPTACAAAWSRRRRSSTATTRSTTRARSRWRNVIIHEIAHQWFGNSVTESDWDHVWLSEGFATYFTHALHRARLRPRRDDRRPRQRAATRSASSTRRPRLPDHPRQPLRHEPGPERPRHLPEGRLDAPHAARHRRRRRVLDRHPRLLHALPGQQRHHRRLPPRDGAGLGPRARLVLRPVAHPRRLPEARAPAGPTTPPPSSSGSTSSSSSPARRSACRSRSGSKSKATLAPGSSASRSSSRRETLTVALDRQPKSVTLDPRTYVLMDADVASAAPQRPRP